MTSVLQFKPEREAEQTVSKRAVKMKRKRQEFTENPGNKCGKFEEEPQIWRPAFIVQQEMELRMIMDNLVKVYETLDRSDNPDCKPTYSYSELVYLALLRSKNFCLPLSEIYRYMKARFTFFRNTEKTNWRNAVRHSLSKTKCFGKIVVGRGLTINGKHERSTNLWCIEPKSIASFARGDYRCTIDKASGTNTLRTAYFRLGSSGMFWEKVGKYLELKKESFVKKLSQSDNLGKIFESQVCDIPDSFENDRILPETLPFVNAASVFAPVDDVSVKENNSESLRNIELKAQGNDSGNESLSSSQLEGRSEISSETPFDGQTVRTEDISALPRLSVSPDLPDLGNVSPLSLSPVPSFGLDPAPSLTIQGGFSQERNSTPPLTQDFLTHISPNASPPLLSSYGTFPQPPYFGGMYSATPQLSTLPSMYGPMYNFAHSQQSVPFHHSTPYSSGTRVYGTNFVDHSSIDVGYHSLHGLSYHSDAMVSPQNLYNEY